MCSVAVEGGPVCWGTSGISWGTAGGHRETLIFEYPRRWPRQPTRHSIQTFLSPVSPNYWKKYSGMIQPVSDLFLSTWNVSIIHHIRCGAAGGQPRSVRFSTPWVGPMIISEIQPESFGDKICYLTPQ